MDRTSSFHTLVNRHMDMWGFIPGFLNASDPRPAVEQIKENYIGGWLPFAKFKLNVETMTLTYPGDPPMRPISLMIFRDEKLFLYESSWVLIMKPDQSWEVSRLD